MNNKYSHLVMIQGIVNRLAQNSFQIKGWSVILVSAMFALSANNTNQLFIYLAYFPAFAFWILDGYFLWQERLYRQLYDHVRNTNEENVDFSMNTAPFKKQVSCWSEVIFSKTLLIFHGTVFGSVVLVMFLIIKKGV